MQLHIFKPQIKIPSHKLKLGKVLYSICLAWLMLPDALKLMQYIATKNNLIQIIYCATIKIVCYIVYLCCK